MLFLSSHNSDLVKYVTFTGTITTSSGKGEILVSSMTGYDATKWSNRVAWSGFGIFSGDNRYNCCLSVRTTTSGDTLSAMSHGVDGAFSITLYVAYR